VSPLEPVEPASESQTAEYPAEAAPEAPVEEAPAESEEVGSVHTVQESVPDDTDPVEPSTGEAGEFNADPANGYFGIKVDPTPNEHYSVDGVINGKPTPETDPDHAEKVRAPLANLGH
jgi:hypothetical protein